MIFINIRVKNLTLHKKMQNLAKAARKKCRISLNLHEKDAIALGAFL